ncbi:MAG: hypothetical protein CMI13_12685 [Oleibacter sp.]|nr:hypothetical protein [Thalassolituus sp.]|tara:strand:- start:364 stop:546 length:183 start_codon:yes stop_codon:yes gene_type:complete
MPDCVKSTIVNKPETVAARCEYRLSLLADKQWKQENQQAISAYNELVERQGVFSEGLRGF